MGGTRNMHVGDGNHLNNFVCRAKENRKFDCPMSTLEDDINMKFYTRSVSLVIPLRATQRIQGSVDVI
jgi:hypothetical protein